MNAELAGYASPPDQRARLAGLRRGIRKARKIRYVLEERLGPAPWPGVRVLDFGCGPGVIAAYFTRIAAHVTGVDVDAAALAHARRRFRRPNLEFADLSAARLPFGDGTFDIVIANHVYEHVGDQAAFFREVRRVLKRSGSAYLAAAGRYQVIEPHYGVPFLSWLPRAAADLILRLAGRPEGYPVRLLSYRRLFKLLRPFDVREYTAAIIEDPRRFSAGDVFKLWRGLRPLFVFIGRRWPAASPTRVFLLSPRDDEPDER